MDGIIKAHNAKILRKENSGTKKGPEELQLQGQICMSGHQ